MTGTRTASTTCGNQRNGSDHSRTKVSAKCPTMTARFAALRDHSIDSGALQRDAFVNGRRRADQEHAPPLDRLDRIPGRISNVKLKTDASVCKAAASCSGNEKPVVAVREGAGKPSSA